MEQVRLGTLSDSEIRSMSQQGFLIEHNFSPDRVKQACYELRCGTVFYDPDCGPARYEITGSQDILLKPKQTLVIITMESLRLPPNVLGRILTKGSLFSVGVLPVNTYADPGFSGNLGIVMHNLSNSYLRIKPGDPIAKIEFSTLQHSVERPYAGQHGYQTGIWPIRTDMILTPAEEKADSRIGNLPEEIERAYGKNMGQVIKRVFRFERRLLLFAGTYFLFIFILIGLMSGTKWIDTTFAVLIGVGCNILASLITFAATNLRKE